MRIQFALALLCTFAVKVSDAKLVYNSSCGCYRDVVYGSATWSEVQNGRLLSLKQSFDLFLPTTTPVAGQKFPLVIWAHPNGITKRIVVGDANYTRLVQPALQNGFAFIALESRHPVINRVPDNLSGPVHHKDAIQALQFIRLKAKSLYIDPKNVFYIGQSRGSLLLWSGLQGELAELSSPDPLLRQSTIVNAMFLYNPQATYSTDQVANLFIAESDRATYLAENPNDPRWGSALNSITERAPPVYINYELAFYNRLVFYPTEYNVHLPDQGLAICAKYSMLGIGSNCSVRDQVPAPEGYNVAPEDVPLLGGESYIHFFKRYLISR